jgi:hypothetical protein
LYLLSSNDFSASGCDRASLLQVLRPWVELWSSRPEQKDALPEQSPASIEPVSGKDGLGVWRNLWKIKCSSGIDVSKARLDIVLRLGDESFDVSNNQRGIAALVKRVKKLHPSRIVLEASGGYANAAI